MIEATLSILAQISSFFTKSITFFRGSPICTGFLLLIVIVIALNAIKRFLIIREKRTAVQYKTCVFLEIESGHQECSLNAHHKYFEENGNSCDGCRGKTFDITDADAEMRVIKSSMWKKIVVGMANVGKNVMPYISFFFTLITAMTE